MWDLPGSGVKPMSSALAGGFFTTEPAGKPLSIFLIWRKLDGLMTKGSQIQQMYDLMFLRSDKQPHNKMITP